MTREIDLSSPEVDSAKRIPLREFAGLLEQAMTTTPPNVPTEKANVSANQKRKVLVPEKVGKKGITMLCWLFMYAQ